ncbi:MAG: class I SAM-dependent methyltransferase [Proteobacteria bacterium]|nr:class I SAM-dependent methyltransferase [Pseudomonadota bacterium]
MPADLPNRSVEFFDTQFRRQAAAGEYALNPFEQAVLPFLSGETLDLGCGLGNLSLAAAARGCMVLALDASAAAVESLAGRAAAGVLPVQARQADLRNYAPSQEYDSVVAIGLAMFFACPDAHAMIARIRAAVRPGGVAAVNVLIEGTTFMGMFTPGDYCLFGEHSLEEAFAGWAVEYLKFDAFPAPGDTVKRFCTMVARRSR